MTGRQLLIVGALGLAACGISGEESVSSGTCRAGEAFDENGAPCQAEGDVLIQRTLNKKQASADPAAFVSYQTAVARHQARVKLTIEQDFSKFDASYYRAWKDDEDCFNNSANGFDQFVQTLDLRANLTDEEYAGFRARFVDEMEYDCKHDTDIVSNWQTDLAAALEHERPVMTAALAASYNAADVGYTLTMQPWMAHESQASFSERCGRENG